MTGGAVTVVVTVGAGPAATGWLGPPARASVAIDPPTTSAAAPKNEAVPCAVALRFNVRP
jgi:hypothetical protein